MVLWLQFSLVSVGLMFIAAMLYTLNFHLLLRETRRHPDIYKQLGRPRGIGDYSRRYNVECYDAINVYFLEHRYMEIVDEALRQRFISHQAWKRRGVVGALFVVINMCICITTIVNV